MSNLISTRVPRWAEALLQSLGADRYFVDDVLGDLGEEFEMRCQWDGVPAARRWYYREALRTAPHLLRDWRRRVGMRGLAIALLGVVTAYAASVGIGLAMSAVTLWVTDIPLLTYIHHWQTTGDGVWWLIATTAVGQLVPAFLGGFVAGVVNRRSALVNATLCAPMHVLIRTCIVSAVGVQGRLLAISAVTLGLRCAVLYGAGGIAAALWAGRRAARAHASI